MSDKNNTNKYIILLQKLTEFLVSNANELKHLPNHASYVAFSARDESLNKDVKKLLKMLKKEDKPVIKADEPKSKDAVWTFTVVN